jgi:HAE1 family hydrophobic/amphiphilic exporter-1
LIYSYSGHIRQREPESAALGKRPAQPYHVPFLTKNNIPNPDRTAVHLRVGNIFISQCTDLRTSKPAPTSVFPAEDYTKFSQYLSYLNSSSIFLRSLSPTGSINRFDRERKILVTASTVGLSLDKVVVKVEEEMKKILPEGYHYRFTGDVENMSDTGKAFGAAVLLAVILIYLILAALYESLIQPFIIMISMPLSLTGIMVALYLSGNTFSLFVMIGIILLLGMVGKNAILVVDFANRAIKEGKSIDDALLEAGEKRLRPILMTTFAMIGAMMPLAFGSGAGHEANAPMALAIIGGLLSSTILTLLVVPAIYKFMYPMDSWLRKWYEKGTVH